MLERRTRRSENAYAASQLYLEQCAQRYQCTTLALANEEGLLIAGIGDDAEEVAAVASVSGSPTAAPWTRRFGTKLQSFSVDFGEQSLHVGVLGSVPQQEFSETLGRIFAPLFAA